MPSVRTLRIRVADGVIVSAALRAPSAADSLLVLGHGAGSDRRSPLLQALVAGLEARGIATLAFNFPYREAGRKIPDRPAVLDATYRAVAARAADGRFARILLGGHSMGGRIASLCAAGGVACDGLVLLGYPLYPVGKAEVRSAWRDAHLPAIQVPMLFVQGSRDDLCALDHLRPVLRPLAAPARLHVVEAADHSFGVLRRDGRTREDVLAEVVGVVSDWTGALPSPRGAGRGRRG